MLNSPGRLGIWPRQAVAVIFGVNFLSLVFQVIWARHVSAIFGSSALSLATLLTAFLTGIALGAWLGARLLARGSVSHRSLGIWLGALGAYTAVAGQLFAAVRLPIAAVQASAWGEVPLLVDALRFVACFLVLIFPTTVIGAAFPTAIRLAGTNGAEASRTMSLVYAADMAGASVGGLAAGFALIPVIGLGWASALGAGAFALMGLWLFWTGHGQVPAPPPARSVPLDLAQRTVLACVGLTGCAGVLLEVTWAHQFYLLFGASLYTQSLVLSAFLLGLSAGSLLARRVTSALSQPELAWAALQVANVGALHLVLLSSDLVEEGYLALFRFASRFGAFQLGLFVVAFGALLGPALLMGAGLPIAARVFTRRALPEYDAALLFSSNTLGGVAGALLAGFAVLPTVGLKGAAVVAATMYAVGAVCVFTFRANPGRREQGAFWGIAVASVALAGFVQFRVDEPGPLASAYDQHDRGASLAKHRAAKQGWVTLFSRQGLYGLVTVERDPAGQLFLANNGKTDASTTPVDMWLQKMLGHIPIVLHPRPRHVLNIGVGAGFTLQAILAHAEVQSVDAVEIDPLVVQAVRQHFSRANGGALDDSRVRVRVADGRGFLLATDQRYDLIVSEPPNIWVAGVSRLFTREFYALARAHLSPGGMVAQWVPGYELDAADLDLVLRTIHAEFRYVACWERHQDIVIVASNEPFQGDEDVVRAVLAEPAVASSLKAVVGGPDALLDLLAQPLSALSPDADSLVGPLNTDDLPLLEFRTLENRFDEFHRLRGR